MLSVCVTDRASGFNPWVVDIFKRKSFLFHAEMGVPDNYTFCCMKQKLSVFDIMCACVLCAHSHHLIMCLPKAMFLLAGP